MTAVDRDLRDAIDQLRVDVEVIAKGKLDHDLSDSERIRMEAKRIAAHHIEKVANDHQAHLNTEYAEVITKVGNSAWHRGRLVGIGDAMRVLELREHTARWWQVGVLESTRAALGRLYDNVGGT